jgi:very-short-patch-repair endonuclease
MRRSVAGAAGGEIRGAGTYRDEKCHRERQRSSRHRRIGRSRRSRFLALCATHGLPRPEVNRRIAGLEADFVFEAGCVVVEPDGWRYHGTRAAFERDRRRDATLTRAGYRRLRFTHRQIERDAGTVASTVAAAIRATAASRTAGSRSAR